MNKQELIESIAHLPSDCSRPRPMIDKLTALELIKLLEEPQPIKLKDVIVRIKQLDIGTRKVWLDEFLNKLGSDYGLLKYKLGYEQGKFEASMIPCDEPQKPVVPQFVADWYEEHKESFDLELWDIIYEHGRNNTTAMSTWIDFTDDALITLVNMHQFGYEIEKQKRYTVKIVAVNQYLVRNTDENFLGFLQSRLKSKFTREELEEAGFGEVFNSPLFEVEEVE